MNALKNYGFKHLYYDYSLFTLQRGEFQINVLVYVDNLIISDNESAAICKFKTYIVEMFSHEGFGSFKIFLGVEISRNSDDIFLSQCKPTLHIISEVGLLDAKLAGVPLEQNHRLARANDRDLEDFEC